MITAKLSIVVPVHNMESRVGELLTQLDLTLARFANNYELIIVNDNSTDQTSAAIRHLMNENARIRLLDLYPESGRGNAYRRGTLLAEGEYIAFCTPDFAVHPEQLKLFYDTMQSTGCDVVLGSKLHPESTGDCPSRRKIVSYGYWLMNLLLFGLNVKDAQTGLKLFRADAIQPIMKKLLVKRYAFDVEALAVLQRQRKKIVSVPITYLFNDGNTGLHVSSRDIYYIIHDTLAIFYRMKILHFYDRAVTPGAEAVEKRSLCFFVGTVAELIKVFPVMQALELRGFPYFIVASGQNPIAGSSVFKALSHTGPDVQLIDPATIEKKWSSVFRFFFAAYHTGCRTLKKQLPKELLQSGYMIVHGDTVSTLLGALLGRRLRMRVVHVEAGLRSYNLLNPFPEEIDRILTSRVSRVHFAPGLDAERNLWNARGAIINTQQNTLLDALAISTSFPVMSPQVASILSDERPYFIFVIHRQENLINRYVVTQVVNEAVSAAAKMRCIFVLHQPTAEALQRFDLLNRIHDCPNIETIPRMEYFDFMKLIDRAAFLITDGGSNQEELYYMGKPCLLLRTHTERSEGLGANAMLFDGDFSKIGWFAQHYEAFLRPPISTEQSPSALIADTLMGKLCKEKSATVSI